MAAQAAGSGSALGQDQGNIVTRRPRHRRPGCTTCSRCRSPHTSAGKLVHRHRQRTRYNRQAKDLVPGLDLEPASVWVPAVASASAGMVWVPVARASVLVAPVLAFLNSR